MSLRVELTIEPRAASVPEAFTAVCAVVNAGDIGEEINLAALSSPSLALELRTADGEPVYLPPPPVPSGEPPFARLAPGDRHEASFEGFLPGWTEPGSYEARCRYRSRSVAIDSPWVPFTVDPRSADTA
jgi:hypothetical protein